MMSYWSELTRPFALPRDGTPTTADPRQAHRAALRHRRARSPRLDAHLGADFTLLDFDCDHMVAQAKPAETAALIRATS